MNKAFKFSFIFLLLSYSAMFAQKSINSYKYIIVPIQYEFQKSEDQYQINSLTKFLFNKAGFTAVLSNETYPEELLKNNCLALKAVVNNNSSLFTTKATIDLIDCYNNKVFSTNERKTKEKEYRKAYHAVIRETFEDIEALGYAYNGSESVIIPEVEKREIISKTVEPAKAENKLTEAPKKILGEDRIEEVTVPLVEKPVVVPEIVKPMSKSAVVKAIEGTYNFGKWGNSKITLKGEHYSVVSGEENFEFATLYKTSKPNFYIIKWNAFKQPQLVEMDSEGSLKVDSENGVAIYKRIN